MKQLKGLKKIWGFNRIQNRDLCDDLLKSTTGIMEVMSLNPIEASEYFYFYGAMLY